jgi:indole-3-glycerol phosphate synthase/phosphoribosylanthranilate isomerase
MALDQILAHKRSEVAGRKAATPVDELLGRVSAPTRSLAAALRAGKPGFILEAKFASPSAGVLRPVADLDTVMASYRRHADAVSVLTDQRFFGGSLERLIAMRQVLDQPLLCKDFILEPYQVVEARAFGADAILLILAAIDDPTWQACRAQAERLGMEVLTEVHDAAEAGRAVALGARIIGINNRNLRTLAVDAGTTARLAPLIPRDRLVVAESGIADREAVAALASTVDGFLVGSALMRAPDLDRAVRELVYGRTKICGLTGEDDAGRALSVGATHGGLVFARESPRRIEPDRAGEVAGSAALDWVGVFADQPPEEIAGLAGRLGLRAVQLHGSETEAFVEEVRALLPPGTEVWKAQPVRNRVAPRGNADRVLLDGWSAERRGGTGHRFDWSLLDGAAERDRLILAGGLGPKNVTEAAGLGTWALDASSGLESGPGRKDPVLLRSFFQARRRLPGRGDGSP